MASKSLGTLTVDLMVKAGMFKQGMNEAERAAAKSAAAITKSKRDMARRLDGIYSGLGKAAAVGFAAVSTAAIAAGVAMGKVVMNGIEAADQLEEASKKVGQSVETLSAMKFVGSQVGVGLDEITGAYGRLSKAMVEASDPSSDMAALFSSLGISATDASGKLLSTQDAMLQIADAFQRLNDPTLELALAQKFFGKSGAQFIELLNLGSEGINDLISRAQDLGIVMSTETATAAADFNDQLATVRQVVEGLGAKLAADLLPMVVELINEFAVWASDADNVRQLSDLLRGAVDLLATAFEWLGGVISDTRGESDELSDALGVTSQQADGLRGSGLSVMDMLGGFMSLAKATGNVLSALANIVAAVVNALLSLASAGAAAWKFVTLDWAGAAQSIGNAGAAARAFQDNYRAVGTGLSNAWGNITGNGNASPRSSKAPPKPKRLPSVNEALNMRGGTDVQAYMLQNSKLSEEQKKRNAMLRDSGAEARKILGALNGSGGGGGKKGKGGGGGGKPKESEEEKAARKAAEERKRQIEQLNEAYADMLLSQEETLYMMGKEGELAQMTWDVEKGRFKDLDQARKDQLLAKAKEIDEQKRLNEEKEKEQKIIENDLKNAKAIYEDLMFEAQLIGKSADEQERLNLARELGSAADSEFGKKAQEQLAINQQRQEQMSKEIELMDTVRGSFSGAFQDWVSGTKSFKDAFLGALDAINAKILQMIADNLMEKLFGGQGEGAGGLLGGLFGGGGSGGGGGFGGFLSSLFGGGMASGGFTKAGMFYEVNEQGPELMTVRGRDYLMMGKHDGKITPAHNTRVGGGMQQVNNFTIQGRMDRRTESQIAMSVGQRAQVAQRRNT